MENNDRREKMQNYCGRSSFFGNNFFFGYAYKMEDYFRGRIGRSIYILFFDQT